MKVKLDADHPAQIIPSTGQRCEPGDVIEVPADLGRSLCEQGSKWTPVAKAVKAEASKQDGDK